MASTSQPVRERAKYLYADIYQYGPDIAEQICHEFLRVLQQIEHVQGQIQLSYDNELDAFSLSCPTLIGPVLHESMEAVLARCHAQHVSNQNITRFAGSVLGPQDPPEHKEEEFKPASTPAQPIDEPVKINTQSTQFAVLRKSATDDTRAQFKPLAELDLALYDHYKTVMKRAKAATLSHDVRVLKAVKPEGQALSKEATAAPVELILADPSIMAALTIRPEFPAAGTNAEALEGQVIEQPFAWDFVGKRCTVEQWIAGMGDTVQLSPDARPQEPPTENEAIARKLQTTQHIVGRMRMPAGAAKANVHGEHARAGARSSSSSSTSPSESSQQLPLLPPPQQTAEKSLFGKPANIVKASAPPVSDSSDESSAEEVDIARILNDSKNNVKQQRRQSHSSPRSSLSEARTELPRTDCSFNRLDGGPASRLPPAPAPRTSPQPMRRSYAKIDSHGLAGRADAQAQWELETGTSLTRLNKAHPPKAEPATLVTRTVGQVRPAWETNVVPNEPVTSQQLIDISVDVTSRHQFPPMLPQTWSKAEPQQRMRVRMPPAPTQEHLSRSIGRVQPPADDEEDMIAFSDTTEFFSARSTSPSPDEQPLERLATVGQDLPRRHVTMRQQARQGTASRQRTPASHGITNKRVQPATRPDPTTSTPNIAVHDAKNSLPGLEGILKTRGQNDGQSPSSLRLQFGLCVIPVHAMSRKSQSTAASLHDLAASCSTLQSEWVPQLLTPSETASLYQEMIATLGMGCTEDLPPCSVVLQVKASIAGAQVAVELPWDPVTGFELGRLLLLQDSITIACPSDLWDRRLELFCIRGSTATVALTDFCKHISLTPRRSGQLEVAFAPDWAETELMISDMRISKRFSKPLSPTSRHTGLVQAVTQELSLTWHIDQTIVVNVSDMLAGGTHSTIVSFPDHNNTGKHILFSSGLSATHKDKFGPNLNWSWLDAAARTIRSSMNKLHFGHKGTVVREEMSKAQDVDILW